MNVKKEKVHAVDPTASIEREVIFKYPIEEEEEEEEDAVQEDKPIKGEEAFEWPTVLDDYESSCNRPNFQSNNDVIEWVVANKCVLMRVITWNLCARPPPPIEHTRVHLLPDDK